MKSKRVKHAISVILVVILIAANVACYNFQNIITMYFSTTNTADETTLKAVTDKAKVVIEDIEAEGIVLLENKNNTLPLDAAANPNINIFGWGSIAPLYGGTGSGGGDASTNVTLQDGLTAAGFSVNSELTDFYKGLGLERGESGPLNGFAPDFNLYEADITQYTDELINNAKAFSDTALIILSRTGGEGSDLATDMGVWDGDSSRHMLELSAKEEAMISLVKTNFEHVVVLINASNAMELGFLEDEGIDGAVWIGGPGETGMTSVGNVLAGKVNPSGALIDTYAYDATSAPAFANAGNFEYSNTKYEGSNWSDGSTFEAYEHYLDYQEGIYVGYRFYETRYVDNTTGQCDEAAYKQAVQYPFGYGLSYTTFEQKITDFKSDEKNIEIEVEVTNTGTAAGKDVVQIYHTPPYTTGGIEKSHVVLSAFGKTGSLEPGKSEKVKLQIPVEEMASYDYKDSKSYVLDAGIYQIKLMDNAHTVLDSKEYEVAGKVDYSGENKRASDDLAATNVFDYAAGDLQYVSRADWEGTLPKDVAKSKEATPEIIAGIADRAITENPEDEDIIIKDNGLSLVDVVGLEYDDPKWSLLLEQLTVSDMQNLIGFGGYATVAVKSVDKPATVDIDGPAGLNALVNEKAFTGASYTSEVVMASTWNTDLVYEMGQIYGEEAVAWGVAGVYAPSMNIHRTPFSGRNFEYYSEDGFLSGQMAASEIKGIGESGVYCYAKHFALNDQETNRSSVATWSNEQAIREIYLKPFEYAVKAGGTSAMMSSFNRIGTIWAGANKDLLQTVLRDEWGFRGMVITDYDGEEFMDPDMAIRSGNDLMLSTLGDMPKNTSNTGKQAMRNASHNILYTVANSSAMGANTGSSLPVWIIVLIIVDAAVIGGIVLSYTVFNKKKKEEAVVENK